MSAGLSFSRITGNLSLNIKVSDIPADDAFMLLDALLRRLADNGQLVKHDGALRDLYDHIQGNIDRERT